MLVGGISQCQHGEAGDVDEEGAQVGFSCCDNPAYLASGQLTPWLP